MIIIVTVLVDEMNCVMVIIREITYSNVAIVRSKYTVHAMLTCEAANDQYTAKYSTAK